MKKIKVLFFLMLVVFYACLGDGNTVASTNTSSFNSMQAEIDKMVAELAAITRTGDADYDFALMMIPLHQNAIDISRIIINNGHHDSLIVMTQSGINSKEENIKRLEEYIRSKNPLPLKDNIYMIHMENTLFHLKNKIDSLYSKGDTDIDYCSIMIVHHQNAIANARIVLDYGNDPEIKEEALTIIDQCIKEIDQLLHFTTMHN